MSKHRTMLKAIRYCGITILTIGIILFTIGFLESGSSILTPIGIGTVMGAIFIFLMGVFFVATEETLEKTEKNTGGFLFKR